jgi:phage terminase large subunit-like protein
VAVPRKKTTKPKAPVPAVDPHIAKAREYCRQVLSGELPACKFVRQACQRQVNDLARAAANDPAFPFVFDDAAAARACRFLEQLPHVKGPKREQLLVLEPWQCFIVTTVHGWKRRSNSMRRFRRAYIEVPRGNGKSFLLSGEGLLGLCADGEGGADIFSAATTTEQANITRGDADSMLTTRPTLAQKLGLKQTAHAISQPSSNSTFKALSREAKNQEGKNIHFALVDELHAHPTRDVWDVVIMGAGKREQSLVWAITTAGTDQSGICYEVRGEVVGVLDSKFANEQLFGIIYTIDGDGSGKDGSDDWRAESSWIKANPNWHASIDQDLFRMEVGEAMRSASKENNFKTKKLNIWCSADVSWMQMHAWDLCADPSLKEIDFAGQPCVDGLDLASKIDIAAKAKLFWRDLPAGVDETTGDPKYERHYWLFVQSFLPQGAIEASKNAQYEGWAKEGWIQTTPGDVLDFDAVKNALRADARQHKLLETGFDPWQALQLANEMQAESFKMVELAPNVQNFSEPMKELEAAVLSKRLHHNGNPALRWMVSNVVCHRDLKENIYPRKQKLESKIDGVVAALMALNRAVLAPLSVSVYASRGFLTL